MSTKNSENIFREYDIRGVVGAGMDEERVFAIGAAYGEKAKDFGAKTVSVGRDCRLSSEEFAAALTSGITGRGVNVTDIGLVSTPMLYFSVFNLTPDGGVIVTASHNPPEYNGLKLCMGKQAMFGDEIKSLARAPEAKSKRARGKITKTDITENYADFLCGGVKVESGMSFAYDCGNGAGGIAAPMVFEKLGLKADGLFTEPDGNFPNHHPDPSLEENLADLIKKVRSEKPCLEWLLTETPTGSPLWTKTEPLCAATCLRLFSPLISPAQKPARKSSAMSSAQNCFLNSARKPARKRLCGKPDTPL
ncbi:phosphohexomutase domain-containing protein [Candidatus Mycalebacterium sp.]